MSVDMSVDAPIWVRVGGGMESVPGRSRHGPADPAFPPPGGPWDPVLLAGGLVGWAAGSSQDLARRCVELGEQLANQQRDHLLARLGHKLRSSTLALQESARQAAFGRPDVLETLFEQAQEVARRAAALEAAAVAPKDVPRGVVLGAVLNLALPDSARRVPVEATVLGSEPVLVEAFSRAREWLGAPINVEASREGAWWRVVLASAEGKRGLAVPELGEPLVRLIVDTQLRGWLDASSTHELVLYLPAHQAR